MESIKAYLTRIDLESEQDLAYWQDMARLHPRDELVLYRLLSALEYRKACIKIVHDLWILTGSAS